jgi:DNA-binding NarL/FixJ family response regulator
MPGGGEEAAISIRELAPSTRVVAYSAFDDTTAKHAMQQAGAVAYAVKGRDELLAVLRRASVR